MNSEVKIEKLDPQKNDYSKEVFNLYLTEGWSQEGDNLSEIQQAILNSYTSYGAFCEGKMVGFFRAFSDGISDAYLLDLIVEPSYRNRGIASSLLKAILSELKSKNLSWITCISTPKAKSLYQKQGQSLKDFVAIRF